MAESGGPKDSDSPVPVKLPVVEKKSDETTAVKVKESSHGGEASLPAR